MSAPLNAPTLRPASAAEASRLSALAFRSKGHWGYDDAFLRQCREELTYTADQINDEANLFVVAEDPASRQIVGFYALTRLDAHAWELEAMFVEPNSIGAGYGRALMNHALRAAADAGARRLVIQSDPYAEPFYLAAGAERVGERESDSVPGRWLPLLEITLAA